MSVHLCLAGCNKPQIWGGTEYTYISWPHHAADLLHRIQIWAQTSVHGEDLLVNDGCDRKAVEAICKSLPQLDVVSSFTLVVKAIDTVDGRTFVVAAKDEEVFRVFDLICQQQANGLK